MAGLTQLSVWAGVGCAGELRSGSVDGEFPTLFRVRGHAQAGRGTPPAAGMGDAAGEGTEVFSDETRWAAAGSAGR